MRGKQIGTGSECIAYHNKMGEFPGCMFSKEAEATWDRSFAMLKKDRENSETSRT